MLMSGNGVLRPTDILKIYSIEASQTTYEKLVIATETHHNIESFNIALSNSQTRLKFFERGDLSKRNTFEGEKNGKEYKNQYYISTDTCDAFIENNIINSNILLIKIDVEDHELNVLKGFSDAFRRKFVNIVQFERATPSSRYKILDFLNFLRNMDTS